MAFVILLCLCLALALHLHALKASRQGRSRVHAAAFWGALAGLVSVPAALFAVLAYLQFVTARTGAADHPIFWILPATLLALWGLSAWSAVVCLVIKFRPSP